MECRTCHHEHPADASVDDARPYADPHFCIARLSEQLSAANLQIDRLTNDCRANAETVVMLQDKLRESNRLLGEERTRCIVLAQDMYKAMVDAYGGMPEYLTNFLRGKLTEMREPQKRKDEAGKLCERCGEMKHDVVPTCYGCYIE